jgi:hypothetical protein
LTFLLGKGCHNREQDFALRIHGVDGFLFKIDKIPMQVIYYEADDEFPCDIKVKFDGGAGRFIEFETLAFLYESFIHELVKLARDE